MTVLPSQPVRRVWIPKPGKAENSSSRCRRCWRSGGPGKRCRIVLEPILEADFLPCSYGFRPKRSAHQALQAMREVVHQGRMWVVDADIESFFDDWGSSGFGLCPERVSDRRVVRLIRRILEAGVLDSEKLSHPGEGAPQGGLRSRPCSPMRCFTVWTGTGQGGTNVSGCSCATPMTK